MEKQYEMYRNIINTIRSKMASSNLTAKELAKKCNVSRQTIYNILSYPAHMPNFYILFKIITALDLTLKVE